MNDLEDVKRQLARLQARAPYLSKIYGPDQSFTPVVLHHVIIEATLTPAVVFAASGAPSFETWCAPAEDAFEGRIAPQNLSADVRLSGRQAVEANTRQAAPMSHWRHGKSGGEYCIRMHVMMAATAEPAVIYYKRFADPLETWCRPAAEFFDGRFVQMASNQIR